MTTKSNTTLGFRLLDALGYISGLAAFIWPPLAFGALAIALMNLWRGRGAAALAQLILAGCMALLGAATIDACVASRTGRSHTGKFLNAEDVAGRVKEARLTLNGFTALLCGGGIFAAWRSARRPQPMQIGGWKITVPCLVWIGLPLLLLTFYGLSIVTWRVLHPDA